MQNESPGTRPIVIAIVAGLLFLIPVAWLASSVSDLGNGVGFILGFVGWSIVGLFGALGVLGWLEKRNALRSMKAKRLAAGAWFSYVGLLLGVWYLAGSSARTALVHIDNFSPHHLLLALDGKPWLEASQGSSQQVRLRRRKFELTAKDAKSGELLDTFQITVDADGPFILNCLGAQSYVQGIVVYSHLGIDSPFPAKSSERWIHAKVDHVFEEPPRHARSKDGKPAVSRSYILRQ